MTDTKYTTQQISDMAAATPLDLVKAKVFAAQFNRSVQSVIAKAKAEGIDYIAKAPAAKRVKGATKPQIVAAIEAKTSAKLEGLEKATASSLGKLLDALQSA